MFNSFCYLVASKALNPAQNLFQRATLPVTQFLIPPMINEDSSRSLVKYSMRKGTRKTVKAVPKRFFRLHW